MSDSNTPPPKLTPNPLDELLEDINNPPPRSEAPPAPPHLREKFKELSPPLGVPRLIHNFCPIQEPLPTPKFSDVASPNKKTRSV